MLTALRADWQSKENCDLILKASDGQKRHPDRDLGSFFFSGVFLPNLPPPTQTQTCYMGTSTGTECSNPNFPRDFNATKIGPIPGLGEG